MKKPHANFHESYHQLEDEVGLKEARSFGRVFAAVFVILAFYPVIDWQDIKIWPLVMAAIFFFFATQLPSSLIFIARIWFKIGALLSKVVNPIVMGLIFFALITPFSYFMRILKKEPLSKIDRDATTYWQKTHVDSYTPESFKRQF